MKQALFLGVFVLAAVYGLYNIVNLYDDNMRWSRMQETPAVRPHEEPMLIMEEGTVPFHGGEEQIRASLADNTIQVPTSSTVEDGKVAYQVFCSHCHGPNLDGQGTVGQSFTPLPTDLAGTQAKQLSDVELFQHISYGGKRAPALASTMSVESRWAVIQYLRHKQAGN
ncbi:MAG: cytochrome c [Proteobacteria bacterium]|nr:cytochrome c [Pseudomonadota bacterium]